MPSNARLNDVYFINSHICDIHTQSTAIIPRIGRYDQHLTLNDALTMEKNTAFSKCSLSISPLNS